MLKPMKPKPVLPKNFFLWLLVGLLILSGIITLIAAFNGGEDGADEVNAVYTNAAATLAAQQWTLGSSTPTATFTSFTQTPNATSTAIASPTLSLIQPVASNTAAAGSGSSGAVGCNNSQFITDVTFPDNTVVTPGQAIAKTWRLQNTGTCPWTPSYKVTFISGNAMGGVTTALTTTVQPGQSADITVNMIAPASAGDVSGTWILTNESGQNFGTTFYILVKVAGATTGTVTPTAPSGTDTATPTVTVSIPTATETTTPLPTETPTSTP
ncbi:MAG: hypothetical protein HXY38_13840 [Chloroflexi bacterium]|nr:hypothetical protein [Chloroflexota bacterium]